MSDVTRDDTNIDLEPQEKNYGSINENNVGRDEIMPSTYYMYAKSLGCWYMHTPIILAYFFYAGIMIFSLIQLTLCIETDNEVCK